MVNVNFAVWRNFSNSFVPEYVRRFYVWCVFFRFLIIMLILFLCHLVGVMVWFHVQ